MIARQNRFFATATDFINLHKLKYRVILRGKANVKFFRRRGGEK